MDSSSLCRIPTLLIENLEEFQNFARHLNEFPGIPVKIPNIWGKFMEFLTRDLLQDFQCRLWGVCVDIF